MGLRKISQNFLISRLSASTITRTLIPKIQPLRVKFLFFFESRVPFTTTRTKSFESSRVYKKIPEKIFLLSQGHLSRKVSGFRQNFSEKTKKDRDRRQKGGQSLVRSLPDSHGQPGYFAVFLIHVRRNSLRPATSAHLIPTVRISYFSVI